MMLNEREGDLEPKSFRLYKAAATHVFKTKQSQGDEQAAGAIELLTHIHDGEEERITRKDELRRKRVELRKRRPRGPRQKVKRFSKADAKTLVAHLAGMKTSNGEASAAWFISTMLTGLRPCEWEAARLSNDYRMIKTLIVVNAKNTNGRSHGQTRTLVLSGITDQQMVVLEKHMSTVRKNAQDPGGFDRLYHNCRTCIRSAADHLWPNRTKHATLYTARHMFSADAKTAFDKVGVAAMMGHASIDTAGENYAPAWSGSGGVGVEPSEQDVAAVTSLNLVKLETISEKAVGHKDASWLTDAIHVPAAGARENGGRRQSSGKAGS